MEEYSFEKKLAKLIAEKERVSEMRRLRDQGMTLKKIGEKYGLTKARVYQILGAGSKPVSQQ